MGSIFKEMGLIVWVLVYFLRNFIYFIFDDISNKYLFMIGYKVIGEFNGNGYMIYKYNKFIKDKMINIVVIF